MFVDKLQLAVGGGWAIFDGQPLSVWLGNCRFSDHPDCFGIPNVFQKKVTLGQKKSAPLSFRKLKIEAYDNGEGRGRLRVTVDLNPSRVLAHAFQKLTQLT